VATYFAGFGWHCLTACVSAGSGYFAGRLPACVSAGSGRGARFGLVFFYGGAGISKVRCMDYFDVSD